MTTNHCSQPGLYRGDQHQDSERRMRLVVVITCIMMVAEVAGGLWYGSMALLADGFHMGTHVGALGISAFAYSYARRYAKDARYSFGTGKVGDLAGFTSAVILGMIALYVLFESASRLWAPVTIVYQEAILIAIVGLAVNLASIAVLHKPGGHTHDDHAGHNHAHEEDNNFRSAYVHIIADAMTSILAIGALACGWRYGWWWLDPVTGMVGAVVILSWAWSLMRDTTATLLDRAPETKVTEQIRRILANREAQVTDIHIWRVGPGAQAAIIALSSKNAMTAEAVREWLKPLSLAHVTVEINQD